MCPSTSAIDLADMLIRAKDRVGGNPSQCLERLTALLGAAREKLARGTNLSNTDIQKLNEALDEWQNKWASPLEPRN